MNCPNCGAALQEGSKFCGVCGSPVTGQTVRAPAPASAPTPNPAPVRVQNPGPAPGPGVNPYPQRRELTEQDLPPKYKPIRAWGYVGYNILFSIPLVGLILLIVFAFSEENINRRNYARSFFCVLLIAIIVGIVTALLFYALGLSLSDAVSRSYY